MVKRISADIPVHRTLLGEYRQVLQAAQFEQHLHVLPSPHVVRDRCCCLIHVCTPFFVTPLQ